MRIGVKALLCIVIVLLFAILLFLRGENDQHFYYVQQQQSALSHTQAEPSQKKMYGDSEVMDKGNVDKVDVVLVGTVKERQGHRQLRRGESVPFILFNDEQELKLQFKVAERAVDAVELLRQLTINNETGHFSDTGGGKWDYASLEDTNRKVRRHLFVPLDGSGASKAVVEKLRLGKNLGTKQRHPAQLGIIFIPDHLLTENVHLIERFGKEFFTHFYIVPHFDPDDEDVAYTDNENPFDFTSAHSKSETDAPTIFLACNTMKPRLRDVDGLSTGRNWKQMWHQRERVRRAVKEAFEKNPSDAAMTKILDEVASAFEAAKGTSPFFLNKLACAAHVAAYFAATVLPKSPVDFAFESVTLVNLNTDVISSKTRGKRGNLTANMIDYRLRRRIHLTRKFKKTVFIDVGDDEGYEMLSARRKKAGPLALKSEIAALRASMAVAAKLPMHAKVVSSVARDLSSPDADTPRTLTEDDVRDTVLHYFAQPRGGEVREQARLQSFVAKPSTRTMRMMHFPAALLHSFRFIADQMLLQELPTSYTAPVVAAMLPLLDAGFRSRAEKSFCFVTNTWSTCDDTDIHLSFVAPPNIPAGEVHQGEELVFPKDIHPRVDPDEKRSDYKRSPFRTVATAVAPVFVNPFFSDGEGAAAISKYGTISGGQVGVSLFFDKNQRLSLEEEAGGDGDLDKHTTMRRGVILAVVAPKPEVLDRPYVQNYVFALRERWRRFVILSPRHRANTRSESKRSGVAYYEPSIMDEETFLYSDPNEFGLPRHCTEHHSLLACLYFLFSLQEVQNSAGMFFIHLDVLMNPQTLLRTYFPSGSWEPQYAKRRESRSVVGNNPSIEQTLNMFDQVLVTGTHSEFRRPNDGYLEFNGPQHQPELRNDDGWSFWARFDMMWSLGPPGPEVGFERWERTTELLASNFAAFARSSSHFVQAMTRRTQTFADFFYASSSSMSAMRNVLSDFFPFLIPPEGSLHYATDLASDLGGFSLANFGYLGSCCSLLGLSDFTMIGSLSQLAPIGHAIPLVSPGPVDAMTEGIISSFDKCVVHRNFAREIDITDRDFAAKPRGGYATPQHREPRDSTLIPIPPIGGNNNLLPFWAARDSLALAFCRHAAFSGSSSKASVHFIEETTSCAVEITVENKQLPKTAEPSIFFFEAMMTNTIVIRLDLSELSASSQGVLTPTIALWIHAPNAKNITIVPLEAREDGQQVPANVLVGLVSGIYAATEVRFGALCAVVLRSNLMKADDGRLGCPTVPHDVLMATVGGGFVPEATTIMIQSSMQNANVGHAGELMAGIEGDTQKRSVISVNVQATQRKRRLFERLKLEH